MFELERVSAMDEKTLTLQDIYDAQERIKPYTRKTPLLREASMDEFLGDCQVYLKAEMLQVSGAFKMRGAANSILSLNDEQRKKGVICVSSGNHGKACATVGHLTGTPITVVLPEDVPQAKMRGVEKMGGTVIPAPRDYNKRMAVAYEQVEKNGYTMVHAYENYGVMAGQGTIGLEILEDLEDVDTVIVPVSGGGMMSGIATAIKSLKPEVKVIGAQASNSDGYAASWRAGKWATIVTQATLADGLTCEEPSEPNYSIMKKYVDDFVTADEDSIRTAVKLIASEAKLMAEPSACVGVGAVLSGSYKPQPNEKICFVLSGGNWDVNMIGKILNDEPVSGVM